MKSDAIAFGIAGVLFGRAEVMAALDVPKLAPAPDEIPECLETGTQNHEGIAGAAAAVDFLASLGAGSTRGPWGPGSIGLALAAAARLRASRRRRG